jgi:hypothetical protein
MALDQVGHDPWPSRMNWYVNPVPEKLFSDCGKMGCDRPPLTETDRIPPEKVASTGVAELGMRQPRRKTVAARRNEL